MVEKRVGMKVVSMAYTPAVMRVSVAVVQRGAWMEIELAVGMAALRAATLVYQLADM